MTTQLIPQAAHMAVFLADILPSVTQISHVTVADSHLGIVPYGSIRNSFRRLFLSDNIIIGSSPASSCDRSRFCRMWSARSGGPAGPSDERVEGWELGRSPCVAAGMTLDDNRCNWRNPWPWAGRALRQGNGNGASTQDLSACWPQGPSVAIIDCFPTSHCGRTRQSARTQSTTDPTHKNCNSIFAPSNYRRVGFVAPFNTPNKKTCWTGGDPRQCRQLSTAYPALDDCHFPFEKHIHMDKGVGWSYFERTMFAYWKESDCTHPDDSSVNLRSVAYTMSTSGPEVSFPSQFTNTSWYDLELWAGALL